MTPPTLLTEHPEVCALQMNRLWEAAWLAHRLDELPAGPDEQAAELRSEIDADAFVTDAEYAAIVDEIVEDIAADLA